MAKEIENWEENQVKSNFVKFNKVGDFIKGVFIDAYKPDKPDQYGKMERKLVVKGIEGKWHESDGSVVEVVEGEVYKVGEKEPIAKQMAETVLGQKIMFKLVELRPTKKGNPAKIITVFSLKDAEGRPVLDQAWLKEQQMQAAANDEFANMKA